MTEATGPGWTLRCGDWRDVLAGSVTECASVITDPPYSPRTHNGQRSNGAATPKASQIHYSCSTQESIARLVSWSCSVAKRWFVMFGDDVTVQWAREAIVSVGWYDFQPIPWVKPDAMPRVSGDGPSPQSEWLAIGRPRRRMFSPELRFRPGFYQGTSRADLDVSFVGQKPEWVMRAVIRDYSEPGDLVVDPFSGTGSTLVSALKEGRTALGAELSPAHFEIARKRLERGFTPPLFAEQPRQPEQASLDLEDP